MPPFKNLPATQRWEAHAKNLLKGELKRRGVTYAQLAQKLAVLGVKETEQNINNKISRGGFTAAFLLQCFAAVGADTVSLVDWEGTAESEAESNANVPRPTG